MAYSWISEEPFVNSIHYETANQQKKVDELVHKYYRIGCPSPTLRDILQCPNKSDLLVSAVRRQCSLARCRSQDFGDGQVTIYDKALLTLSRSGENPAEMCVLELYLTEFLGIVPIASPVHSKDTAAKHLTLYSTLQEAGTSQSLARRGSPFEKHHRKPHSQILLAPTFYHDSSMKGTAIKPNSEPKQNPIFAGYHESESNNSGKDNKSTSENYHQRKSTQKKAHHFPKTDPISSLKRKREDETVGSQAERLFNVFLEAKEEYSNELRKKGMHDYNMVRFVRDSAENTLTYLRANHMTDHRFIPILEEWFKFTKNKATALVGGRERHFDKKTPLPRKRPHPKKRTRGAVDSYRP